MQDKAFTCDKCGICCKHIGHIDELKHLDNGDGTCSNLGDENTCKVYDDRPIVCNVRKLWERDYQSIGWFEFSEANEECCLMLKNKQMKEG